MNANAEHQGQPHDRRGVGPTPADAPLAVAADVLLDALFLRSPFSMAIYDAAGRVVAVNEAFTRLTGVRRADVSSGYSLLTDGELDRCGVLPEVQRAFAGETVTLPPMRYGATAQTDTNGTTWMRAHLHPIRDAGGAVTHVLMTHVDLTVHLLRSDPLRAGPAGIGSSADRERSVLMAVMSHELRTPLNAIMGYTDLLQAGVGGGSLSTAQAAHLQRIHHASRQLGQLIDTVLAYATLEAGDADVATEVVDVSALVEETVEAIRPAAAVRGLDLELEPQDTVRLETDPAKVRQILSSLLSNALKFTEQGTIRVGVRDQPAGVHIHVADTGIGIGDDDLGVVFEPFTQIDSTLTRRVDGAGLGLALAAGLARLLGGGITVDSQLGTGSTFTLRLPRPASRSSTG